VLRSPSSLTGQYPVKVTYAGLNLEKNRAPTLCIAVCNRPQRAPAAEESIKDAGSIRVKLDAATLLPKNSDSESEGDQQRNTVRHP